MANLIKIKRSAVQGKIPTPADIELGELAINTYDGKLFLKKDDGLQQYVVEVGGQVGFEVKNQTGATIPKGTVVKFAGTLGASARLLVAPFLANGTDPSEYVVGVVENDIPNGSDGFAIDHGKIFNLDTSAFAEGTILYASATVPGGLTATRPAAPNNKVTVAAVINSSATAGSIEVRVTPGSALDNDELVELGTLANNDGLIYNSTAGRFENRSATGTGSVVLNNSPTLTTPTLGNAFSSSIINGLGAVSSPSYTFTGDTNTGMWSPAADTLAFSTAGGERLRVDSAGNVGIGTSSPGSKLEVTGNIHASSGGDTRKVLVGLLGAGIEYNVDGSTILQGRSDSYPLLFKTNSAERMRIDSSGNVGIGTAAPGAELQVNNAAASQGRRGLRVSASGWTSAYGELVIDTSAVKVDLNSSIGTYPLSFSVAGTERMRINSSGNLLVGTTTSNGRVSIVGDQLSIASSSGSGSLGLQIKGTALSAIPAAQVQGYIATGDSTIGTAGDLLIAPRTSVTASIRFITGTTPAERVRIDSSGNVGIGTATPSSKLHVVGDINLDGISVRDTAIVTTTATTQVALTTFSATTYDSAEVVIKAKQGTAVHITKLLIVSDGTTASSTEFGTVLTGSSLFTTDVDISAGSIRVLITPTSATSTVFKTSYELITA